MRTVPKKKNTSASEDKTVKGLVQKLAAQGLPELSQINLFTEDDQVIKLENPEVYGSFQNKTMICTGKQKKVPIQDCLADVISEIPPQQL